jgi:hypothetical protein
MGIQCLQQLDGIAACCMVVLICLTRRQCLWSVQYGLSFVCVQVAAALAATTEYDEPDPPMPPPNATPEDMAALEAKACAVTSLLVAGFRVHGIKGTVKGYSSIVLPVEFTPRVAGRCDHQRHDTFCSYVQHVSKCSADAHTRDHRHSLNLQRMLALCALQTP